MIPYNERELCQRFNSGELVAGVEFRFGALDFYSEVVHPLWKQDKTTKQGSFDIEGFEGDVYYKRVNPLPQELTPEQKHFNRDKTNPLTDDDRLSLCRAELARIKTYERENGR